MYAMPLKANPSFFEGTSLSFQECKERCMTRLEKEEEFCYIPMGGPVPARDQRVVGFGGAAAIVHRSTGYTLCRTMLCAGAVTKVLAQELNSANWNPVKLLLVRMMRFGRLQTFPSATLLFLEESSQ